MNWQGAHERQPPSFDIILMASFPNSIVSFRGRLIRSIVDTGRSVGVMAPGVESGRAISSAIKELGATAVEIPLERTGVNPLRDLALCWRLVRLFRKYRPQFFLGYTAKPVIYGSIAAWVARVPRRYALITGLGFAFTDGRTGYVSSVVRSLYKLSLRTSHKIFFQNKDDCKLFREQGLVPEDTSCVVVNGSGVDTQTYVARELPEGGIRFLMIGRLIGDKGVREFVAAARMVQGEFPQAEFALAGWIDTNPDSITKAELAEWSDQGVVEFLGRLDDVRDALASCSVFVLPSYREGMPRTVLEAMATGRAIITTDVPGCRDTVIEGRNGILVEARSVDGLADAMRRFLNNPDLIALMGRRSRRLAEEKFDDRKVNAVMMREMGL